MTNDQIDPDDKPPYVSDTFWRDPITVADRLRWAREHWLRDNTQPRDLDSLLNRAADTLDNTVPKHWRTIAALEAVMLIVLAIVDQFR